MVNLSISAGGGWILIYFEPYLDDFSNDMLEWFTFSFLSDEDRFWENLRLGPALSGNVQGKQRRTGTLDPQHFSSLILEKICGSSEK